MSHLQQAIIDTAHKPKAVTEENEYDERARLADIGASLLCPSQDARRHCLQIGSSVLIVWLVLGGLYGSWGAIRI